MKKKFFLLFAISFFFSIFLSCGPKNTNKLKQEDLFSDQSNKEIGDTTLIIKDNIQIEQDSLSTEIYSDSSFIRIEHDFIRGIYLNAYTVSSPYFPVLLDTIQSVGINTVVFDLKNMRGEVFSPEAQNQTLTNDNLISVIDIDSLVFLLHKRNMKAVARLVMFHDRFLAAEDSSLRAKDRNGKYWQENKGGIPSWLDPSNPKVQNQLLGMISKIARHKVDEIQLDYIRFPTQGKIGEAIFNFQAEDSLLYQEDSTYVFRKKSDIIVKFIENAKAICDSHGVTLTADIFAIVAWQRKSDINNTGQDISRMSEILDSIHPMIYSSHFDPDFGFRNNIHNEPYYLVYQVGKLSKKFANRKCRIIPYIQSNPWKVNFKKEYIQAQLQAIKDLKIDGFILWNSTNKYREPLKWLKLFNVSRET